MARAEGPILHVECAHTFHVRCGCIERGRVGGLGYHCGGGGGDHGSGCDGFGFKVGLVFKGGLGDGVSDGVGVVNGYCVSGDNGLGIGVSSGISNGLGNLLIAISVGLGGLLGRFLALT